MTKRSSLPLLVTVAVVALVIGSFGSATAAAVTKGTVKRIATKVVQSQAPHLTVAKAALADKATLADTATTANNATSLGGAPASSYAKRFFARVSYTTANPTLIVGSPGVTVGSSETSTGFVLVNFPQSMDSCAVVATAVSGTGTQITRRSTGTVGATVQIAVKDDAGAAIRSSFDVIAVC